MTEEDMPEWKKRLQRMDASMKNKKEDGKQRCEKCQGVYGRDKKAQWERRDIDKDKLCERCHQIEEYKWNPSKTKTWYNNKRRLDK
tara:strand:- start:2399 stop:2656 length:258 start_codon:yes stop_codon:yes gene_type:complete